MQNGDEAAGEYYKVEICRKSQYMKLMQIKIINNTIVNIPDKKRNAPL